MKLLNVALFASILGFSFACAAQAQEHFQVKQMWVSGNGARVVAEASSESNFDPIIRVFDAHSRKKLGEITRAHRLIDGTTYYEREWLKVRAISKDGHHLLLSRLPLWTEKMRQELKNYTYDSDNYEVLEAWDISGKPRLEWSKPNRHIGLVDARWLWDKIVVLTNNNVQRWSEQGKIQSKVALPSAISVGALSPDGTRAAVNDYAPILIDTKTAKVIVKLDSSDDLAYPTFVIGPNSLFVYSETVTVMPTNGESLPWFGQSIYDVRKSKWEEPMGVALFSPDGLAIWDQNNHLFRDVRTHQPTSLKTPKLFADKTTQLKAISNNGHVWAGIDAHSQPIWTFAK